MGDPVAYIAYAYVSIFISSIRSECSFCTYNETVAFKNKAEQSEYAE